MIERAAFVRCGRLERIESDEYKFGDCVVAAGKDALMTTRSNAFKRMADGVGAGRARISDDLARRVNIELCQRVDDRFLRRIIRDPFRCATQARMGVERPIIIFAEGHSSAGRADNGQAGFEVAILLQRLPSAEIIIRAARCSRRSRLGSPWPSSSSGICPAVLQRH